VRGFAPVLLVLGVLTSCGGDSPTVEPTAPPSPAESPAASPTPTPVSGPVFELTETDFEFVPATFAMRTDQSITINNEGQTVHNFSIEGTVADVDTQAGETTALEAIGGAADPGTYNLFCKYHRSQGMTGTIIIVQGEDQGAEY
jgi:plastocyanin